jgi:hypothetical protein
LLKNGGLNEKACEKIAINLLGWVSGGLHGRRPDEKGDDIDMFM